MNAYHGSHHLFKAFDPAFIGAGQGFQAEGHGFYFAEAYEVAKEYADWSGDGFVYHVELNVTDETLIDLDRPVADQHPVLLDLIRPYRPAGGFTTGGVRDICMGGSLRRIPWEESLPFPWIRRARRMGKAVEPRLLECGLQGFSYLTRTCTIKTRNFVIFSADDITISKIEAVSSSGAFPITARNVSAIVDEVLLFRTSGVDARVMGRAGLST